MDYCVIRAATSRAPYFLLEVLILFLLCTLVRCVSFYMLENTELVNETKMKRVVLNLQPAECLGEWTHFYGCKLFNVFYDEFGRLTCDLYAILDGTLESSPLALHFTLNAHAFKSPTTTQNGITTLQANPTTQKPVSSTSPTVIRTTTAPSQTQKLQLTNYLGRDHWRSWRINHCCKARWWGLGLCVIMTEMDLKRWWKQ